MREMSSRLGIGMVLGLAAISSALGASTDRDEAALVLDGRVKATVETERGKQRVKGRLVVEASATEAELKEGRLNARRVNLVFYKVNQSAIAGSRGRARVRGALSFQLSSSAQEMPLYYDRESMRIQAILPGVVHYRMIDEILGMQPDSQDEQRCEYNSYTQTARIRFQLDLMKPLREESTRKKTKIKCTPEILLEVDELPEAKISPFRIAMAAKRLRFWWIWLWRWEIVRSLPIRPVSVKSSDTDANPTGSAFNALLPFAREEWRKADIVFDVRSFTTVTGAALKVISDGEEDDLYSTVDEDDAIEVFYCEKFSPSDLHGGGVTYSGGTEEACVVTSDENDNGIDLRHLAHELGHVLTLKHPGAGCPSAGCWHRRDGSYGTLMCPSGFANDNPAVQSEDNAENANNPLLRLSLTRYSDAEPDCEGDAAGGGPGDCGDCP